MEQDNLNSISEIAVNETCKKPVFLFICDTEFHCYGNSIICEWNRRVMSEIFMDFQTKDIPDEAIMEFMVQEDDKQPLPAQRIAMQKHISGQFQTQETYKQQRNAKLLHVQRGYKQNKSLLIHQCIKRR